MRETSWLVLLLLAPLGAAPGCGGESVSCDFTEAPSLVVGGGTTQTGFLSLNDGDVMTVVLGPQGLYMVTPSIRVRGMYPGESGRTGGDADPLVELEALLGTTVIGHSARQNLGLTPGADADERLGIFLPFDVDLADYLGMQITITGRVTDACGRTATDSLDVIVQQ